MQYMFLKDLSLRGFWLQKWVNSDKTEDCRRMIDYLLGLVHEGKLKYEYVLLKSFCSSLVGLLLDLVDMPSSRHCRICKEKN